jgi:hypothetical protein
VLTALAVRFDVFSARHVCPDESTIRDELSRIDAGDSPRPAAGTWLIWSREGRRSAPMSQTSGRPGGRAPPQRTRSTVPRKLKGYALDGKRVAGARRPDGTRSTCCPSLITRTVSRSLNGRFGRRQTRYPRPGSCSPTWT